MAPSTVFTGSYRTSYEVIMPFLYIGGISSQVTLMEVDESTSDCTLMGAIAGTVKKNKKTDEAIIIVCNVMI